MWYQIKEEIVITVPVLISATGHVIIVGIYNYLLSLPHSIFLCSQQAPQLVLVLCLVGDPVLPSWKVWAIHTFLPELRNCSFPLTWIPGSVRVVLEDLLHPDILLLVLIAWSWPVTPSQFSNFLLCLMTQNPKWPGGSLSLSLVESLLCPRWKHSSLWN